MNINGIKFKVDYTVESIDWTEGEQIVIDIYNVNLPNSEINLFEVLSKDVLDKMEKIIIEQGKEK